MVAVNAVNEESSEDLLWNDAVISILQGAESVKVKKLRKQVLLSLQFDDADKAAKKRYKKTIQALEEKGDLTLDAEGIVTIKKSKKRKSKEETKQKKKKRNDTEQKKKDVLISGDNDQLTETTTAENSNNKPCKGNPSGTTRLFLGNLPFAVDEASLEAFLPGVTHIKWITDKETGKFYGSAFVEMDTCVSAANAVARAGEALMGRQIKVNFAPARSGEVWPPPKKVISGGSTTTTTTGGQAGGKGIKAMGAKPENCVKLFIGNLSYEIDDEAITKFFATVDAELKAVRWLSHKESGDFKGCGFAEFWDTDACEKAATLNGKNLLDRPIRIDWSD
jgi:nucleolin